MLNGAVDVTNADGREVFIAAAGDGAGSAELGAVGSRIACHSIIEQVHAWIRKTPDLRRFAEDVALDWLDGVRESIATEAGDRGARCGTWQRHCSGDRQP